MHIHHTTKNEEKGWRSNWFVKNVLAELPIIGGFFHSANIPHALHNAGKSAAMLAGGSMAMMLEILKKTDTDTMATSMTKSITNMAIGMALGTITYNVLFSAGSKVYYSCHGQNSESTSTSSPMQSLVVDVNDHADEGAVSTYNPNI